MMKMIAILLSAVMALTMVPAAFAEDAEAEDSPLRELEGMLFEFSSGAGAWATEITLGEDGWFTGDYHDSEMGETGAGYPDGTIYVASFSGRLTVTGRAGEYGWTVKVEQLAQDPVEEEIILDGTRYVRSEIYGIREGDEMILYAPGTPVSVLSEDMQFWAHLWERENPETLDTWFLANEAAESGFAGFR